MAFPLLDCIGINQFVFSFLSVLYLVLVIFYKPKRVQMLFPFV